MIIQLDFSYQGNSNLLTLLITRPSSLLFYYRMGKRGVNP